jgi:GNAT superfamily N-acetyltransferase
MVEVKNPGQALVHPIRLMSAAAQPKGMVEWWPPAHRAYGAERKTVKFLIGYQWNLRRNNLRDIEIRGYYPGVIGKITELHAVYYNQYWGFDVTFETQVGGELAQFVRRFDGNRDGLWVATQRGIFAGSIAIDGVDAFDEGARLRWFIVDPQFQRSGIGRHLMTQALDFCKQKRFPKVYLWTFEGLENARRLYEAVNFRLCQESQVSQWGRIIQEQKYELFF